MNLKAEMKPKDIFYDVSLILGVTESCRFETPVGS